MKNEEADAIVNPLFDAKEKLNKSLMIAVQLNTNVIVIIWESFTEKVLNKSIDGKPVIKFFPELMKEGIYFSNCYSSGDRTDKGISAIIKQLSCITKRINCKLS